MSSVPATSALSYLEGEQAPFAWESTFARRSELMENLFLRDLLKAALIPGIISFAGGLPASEFFPTDEVKMALIRILH